MLETNLQSKIKNTGLVLSLVFGFLMFTSVAANAQYNDNDSYNRDRQNDQHDNRRDNRRSTRNSQNKNHRDNDNDDSSRSNNGNYNRSNGSYGNNGGYYGNNGYGNDVYRIAQQNGYNDGLRKGQEDAYEGHNNPTGTSDYKRATNGCNSSYGNKNAYKDSYRQAFLQGFRDGYNRSYNRGNYGNRRRSY